MIEFSYPLAFSLLALPFVMALLPLSYATKKRALHFSSFELLKEASSDVNTDKPILKASWFQRLVMFLVYALVVVGMAKPVLIGEPIVKEESLREVLICVDLSQSMEAVDFRLDNGKWVNRLVAQKSILNSFFETLKNENFALIFYGSAAFVQSPFTNDSNATKKLLNEAQIGMAGPKTAIGDAIGLGIKLFDESDIKDRLMILMSDGSDSGSKVPPLKAAELAKKKGIKIETIAVGNPNAKGEEKVDAKTLRDIANVTGGNFYFASNTKRLEKIYVEIDKLHPKKVKKHSYRPTTELFAYPLMVSVALLFLYALGLFLQWLVRGRHV